MTWVRFKFVAPKDVKRDGRALTRRGALAIDAFHRELGEDPQSFRQRRVGSPGRLPCPPSSTWRTGVIEVGGRPR